jgi:hypothetical protein
VQRAKRLSLRPDWTHVALDSMNLLTKLTDCPPSETRAPARAERLMLLAVGRQFQTPRAQWS